MRKLQLLNQKQEERGVNMKVKIRLKDLCQLISTKHKLRVIDVEEGELFYPSYGNLDKYDNYFVVDIEASSEQSLVISIAEYLY